MKKVIFYLIIALLSAQLSYSSTVDTNRTWGVTIDGINNLNNIVTSLSNLCKKPTTRIVFDEFVPATDYQNAVNQIHNVSFIMGEILDSYYMNQYNLTQYVARTNEYVNLLGDKVDIWEVGNEVNGEWLGTISDVVCKIDTAYKIIKSKSKKTELTLYYNKNCYENAQNEMFRWVNQRLSTSMRNGLDYVLISYYEDDCNNLQPNWQQVFDSLHILFPNSKIGIGECGTSNSSQKAIYINRYYRMNVNTPKFIGGYFWWYYKQDCVPYTNSLWTVLNSAMTTLTGTINSEIPVEAYLSNNYPNPFNPSTKIEYAIPKNSFVTLKIYDNLGREVSTLVNEQKSAGKYSIDYNANNLTTGVYYYKLTSDNFSNVKKMILVK
jgi:hypothetical protein